MTENTAATGLIGLRRKHGADTPIGHLCSNIHTTRRSLFGLGAALAAVGVGIKPAETKTISPATATVPTMPLPIIGEIRPRFSHYEAGYTSNVTHIHASAMMPVAVIKYQQWDGGRWVDFGFGQTSTLPKGHQGGEA